MYASAAQAHYECLQTDNGTILIGSAVSIKFLARIILLGSARYTIWMSPNPKQLRGVTQHSCTCAKCGYRYVNGTQWCYRKCWVPLTWFAVQQRFMMIVDQDERDRELKAVYGLTRRQFSANQDEPGSSVNSLDRTAFSPQAMRSGLLELRLGAAGGGRRAAARKRRTSKSPGPLPAAAATLARSASPTALAGDSRGSGARSSRDEPRPDVIVYGIDPNGAGSAARMRRIQPCAQIPNS